LRIDFTLNGRGITIDADPLETLIDILREKLELHGAKRGCGIGECGSCLVIFNGVIVNSCLIPAFRLEGSEILTPEGLKEKKDFPDADMIVREVLGGRRELFCSNGVIMAVKNLFTEQSFPDEKTIREALKGIDCREVGKENIIEGVKRLVSARPRRRQLP